ncbi:MAG: hypothetical protein LBC40_01195 [Dysgonamonadaceae bacterium]|jgi:hypothetical protein|nr:hypothetical protein [Dysgonamonadaceae bacterium]
MRNRIFNYFTAYCLLLTVYCLLFTACGDDEGVDTSVGKGFLEYQYEYESNVVDEDGNPVPDLAYERVSLSNAFFVVRQDVDPAQLPSADYRIVELYFLSENFTGMNESSLGGSYVKIQLADTLASDPSPDKLLPYSYVIRTSAQFLAARQPSCLEFSGNMFLGQDAGSYTFKNSIAGEAAKRVILYDYRNGKYQIMANGLFNGKIYNFHYVGPLQMSSEQLTVN